MNTNEILFDILPVLNVKTSDWIGIVEGEINQPPRSYKRFTHKLYQFIIFKEYLLVKISSMSEEIDEGLGQVDFFNLDFSNAKTTLIKFNIKNKKVRDIVYTLTNYIDQTLYSINICNEGMEIINQANPDNITDEEEHYDNVIELFVNIINDNDTALKEINFIENSAKLIQKKVRESIYNPSYTLCQKIMKRNFEKSEK